MLTRLNHDSSIAIYSDSTMYCTVKLNSRSDVLITIFIFREWKGDAITADKKNAGRSTPRRNFWLNWNTIAHLQSMSRLTADDRHHVTMCVFAYASEVKKQPLSWQTWLELYAPYEERRKTNNTQMPVGIGNSGMYETKVSRHDARIRRGYMGRMCSVPHWFCVVHCLLFFTITQCYAAVYGCTWVSFNSNYRGTHEHRVHSH